MKPKYEDIRRRFASLGSGSVGRTLANIVLGHPIAVLVAAVALCWDAVAPSIAQQPEVVRSMHGFAQTVGTGAIVVWSMMDFVTLAFSGRLEMLWISGGRALQRYFALVLALAVVRTAGSEIANTIEWMHANSELALAGVGGLLVVQLVLRSVPRSGWTSDREFGVAALRRATSAESRKRSAEDVGRTAAHEAGHLILFACLPALPKGLRVTVLEDVAESDPFKGCINHDEDFESAGHNEQFARWQMRMFLAGTQAERLLLNNSEDGGNSDSRAWLAIADNYLLAGLGEVFFAEPDTDPKVAHNRQVLAALKTQQQAEVTEFLEQNLALLRELSNVIAQATVMDRDALAPYLARVQVPTDWQIDSATTQLLR